MLHLIKILSGRIGVPEPERIVLESEVNVSYGTPVILKDGTLEVMSATSTALPTHLILKDSVGKEILACPILPEMIFEVPASASPATMKVGGEYLMGTGGTVSATPVASGKRGAYLVDKTGALTTGDNLLVCFR